MFLNNSFNILPWYDSLEKQSSKKWYTFGQSWPLLCPKGTILPFQFVCDALEVTSNIQAVNVNTNEITDLGVAPSVIQGSQPNSTYYIVKLASVAVPVLSVGTYYLRFKTSLGYLYSEEIAVIDDSNECIKVQYWNEDTLNFASGEINFADDFKFEFYIRSTIGKPEYEFEEELTKRLGYKFIESQTSNKVYKFAFVAPEYICDAMRLIRLCDYVKLTTKFDSYNALSFAYEPKWQDQGDLAAVDVEFDTDCIIQKLESFNRRIKESFYNALLADIDEPVLFSTDTVAQYYTEFTTTSFINGKLIRQLDSILPDELQSNLVDLVLPIDNMADDKNTAKKVSLPDLMSLVTSSDISKLFKGHFDADGNLQWIEALAHIGVNGGVTMFIDNGTMSLPQLYSGLPIDGKTLIRDENGVLMINPDIDLGGGGLTEVYWDDIKLKPTFASVATSGKYADLSGLPDLSAYATTKYLTAELEKYVTRGTDQTIKGFKEFEKGLSIGGLPITKSQDDVIYLDANLVVRGGITMFGTNSVDVPTIMDAIATDGVNLKVVDGVLTFVGTSSGGLSEVHWDDVKGRPTLLSSFIDDFVQYNYLPLSGGTLESSTTRDVLNINSTMALGPAFHLYKGNQKITSFGHIPISGNSGFGSFWINNEANVGILLGSDRKAYITMSVGLLTKDYTILHSGNWSQYVTAADGGNYLPLSGGTMTSGVRLDAAANIYLQSTSGNNWNIFDVNGERAFCVEAAGYVGVGRAYDSGKTYRLAVEGNSYIGGYEVLQVAASGAGSYNRLCLSTVYMRTGENWQSEIISDYYGNNVCTRGGFTHGVYFKGGRSGFDNFIFLDSSGNPIARISASNTGMNHHFFGDFLVTGGITMYSDIRKKTKLQDVELTLQQIAEAPLIEHYYNSDEKRTTHVGTIAQYWAETIGNDWFCKLDSEGYYTMEIQNAALASAISIARELVKYESKTDKKIRLLKKRIGELEDKIEELEKKGA